MKDLTQIGPHLRSTGAGSFQLILTRISLGSMKMTLQREPKNCYQAQFHLLALVLGSGRTVLEMGKVNYQAVIGRTTLY